MMKSITSIIAVALGVTAIAQGQVTYTGYAESAQGVSAIEVGTYEGSVVPVLAAGQAGFTADDIYSFRVDRGTTAASAKRSHFFSLETANLPVRLDLLTGLFDGKLVFGGGGLATNYTVNLSGTVSVYEYDDLNRNNKFDPSEASYLCATTGALPLATLSGNGLSFFDTATAGAVSTYVLGANSRYMLALESSWALAGTAALTDPTVVITVEHVTPLFSGTSATFNYQTVPEPSTAALLAAAALVPLGRRRRAA